MSVNGNVCICYDGLVTCLGIFPDFYQMQSHERVFAVDITQQSSADMQCELKKSSDIKY